MAVQWGKNRRILAGHTCQQLKTPKVSSKNPEDLEQSHEEDRRASVLEIGPTGSGRANHHLLHYPWRLVGLHHWDEGRGSGLLLINA